METSDDENDSDGYQPPTKKDRSAEQEAISTNEGNEDDIKTESDDGAIHDDDDDDDDDDYDDDYDDVSDSSYDSMDFT